MRGLSDFLRYWGSVLPHLGVVIKGWFDGANAIVSGLIVAVWVAAVIRLGVPPTSSTAATPPDRFVTRGTVIFSFVSVLILALFEACRRYDASRGRTLLKTDESVKAAQDRIKQLESTMDLMKVERARLERELGDVKGANEDHIRWLRNAKDRGLQILKTALQTQVDEWVAEVNSYVRQNCPAHGWFFEPLTRGISFGGDRNKPFTLAETMAEYLLRIEKLIGKLTGQAPAAGSYVSTTSINVDASRIGATM